MEFFKLIMIEKLGPRHRFGKYRLGFVSGLTKVKFFFSFEKVLDMLHGWWSQWFGLLREKTG